MPDATPHYGVPPFILGMTRQEVVSAAGQPDRIEQQVGVCSRTSEVWFYPSLQTEVTFEEEFGWFVSAITVESPSATVNGASLVGCRAEALAILAAAAGIPDVRQTDDFEEFGLCYASQSFGLQFWALRGIIIRFTLFPQFDASRNVPHWPAA